MNKRKPYTRFFMGLTFISVCCILVLAVVIFYWYRNLTVNNIDKANQNVLLNTETVFMNYKDTVQNYTMDFYANPNINALMMSGDNGWSDQLYSALSQIKGALVVNPYLENAYIFGLETPVAMFENMPLSPESKQELFLRVQDSVIVESPFLWEATMNDGRPVTLLTVFYNDRAFGDSAYNGAVAITVNLAKLQNRLYSDQAGGATRYAVLEGDGDVLMRSSSAAGSFETAAMHEVTASGSEQGSLVWREGGEPLLITYVHSPHNDLWFVSETFYQDSIRDISNARNLMIGLCLALTLCAAIASYLLSGRIYRPIGERLEQLRKENDDGALMRWLLAPRASLEDGDGQQLQLNVSQGAYFVCVLLVGSGGETGQLRSNRDTLLESLSAAFAGLANLRVFRPHPDTAVLIVSALGPGSFDDENALAGCWERLEKDRAAAGIRYALGISGLSGDSGLLKQKYEEAAEALRYAKFREHRSVIFADETAALAGSSVPDSALEPLLQAVRKKAPDEEIRLEAERLLETAASYRIESATVALAKLALELGRTAELKADIRDTGFLGHYQLIWQMTDYRELRDWLEVHCRSARERLAAMGTVQTRSLAGEAVQYIGQHFNDQKLSLNALADKLSISPAYLSRLIADETGSSFPDLVNLRRLEHAQKLLVSELGLDIREIAEQVGYNSSTYFTTQFKKRYGVTPSKWRMNHILSRQQ